MLFFCFVFFREEGLGEKMEAVMIVFQCFSIVCGYGMSVHAECVYLCTRVSISDFSSTVV